MKLDITPLLSGKVRAIPFSYEISCDGDGFPMPPAGVTIVSPVCVEGRISDSGSCLHLRLDVEAEYSALCDRCADDMRGSVKTSLERMVAEEGSVEDENRDDYFIACDGMLDLDLEIAEELMLAFPSQMLCRDDCRGVCPVCGQNFNYGECGCAAAAAEEIDPRWQALAKLLEEQKKEEE